MEERKAPFLVKVCTLFSNIFASLTSSYFILPLKDFTLPYQMGCKKNKKKPTKKVVENKERTKETKGCCCC